MLRQPATGDAGAGGAGTDRDVAGWSAKGGGRTASHDCAKDDAGWPNVATPESKADRPDVVAAEDEAGREAVVATEDEQPVPPPVLLWPIRP